ncbi:MAG: phosphatase PAP2 family protein [Rhizobiaceae bacterium]|nr:phosphatase PAP2 family protein [Rhizobiaceae bacterium]
MNQSGFKNSLQHSRNTLAGAWQRTFRPRRAGVSQGLLPSTGGFWVFIVVLIVAVAWLFLLRDAGLVRWKRQMFSSDGVTITIFELITLTGTSGWILVITAMIGLYLSMSPWSQLTRPARLWRADLYADVNFIFFTVALSGIAANLLKNTIGRARPRLLEEFGPHYFNHGAFDSTFASFPSGHSTTSGAISMALILLYPRYWILWLVFGLLGGMSRVMVDAHYPSDALAGLTFGAGFVVLAARWLAQRGTMFRFSKSWIPMRRHHQA